MDRKELTEKLFGIVHSINIENAEKRQPVYTLAEMLAYKNITALRKLGRLYKVSGFSKMDKPTILPALVDKMTDADMLAGILFVTDEVEWDFFKKAVKTKRVTDDKLCSDNYLMLLKIGVLSLYYDNDHFHYVIPAEIRKTYKTLETLGFPAEKEHVDLLNMYAIAATNLYGVISIDDFVELFNSQNSHKTDADEMFDVLLKFVILEYGYCFWDEYLVNDDFEDNDFEHVAYFAETAAAKPRYIPDRQKLLEFSDWDYIEETPELGKIRAYINQNLPADADLAEDIVEEVYFLCKYEARPQGYMDIFKERNIQLNFEQIKTLLHLTTDLQNNTRLWINNGHTPNEMAELMPASSGTQSRVIKVGRNSPCPCGSGRKYKNCCG